MAKNEKLNAANELEQQGDAATAATAQETAGGAEAETAKFFEAIPAVVAPPAGTTGVNLRQGPGIQYGVLQVLEAGCAVGIQELPLGAEVPGWALVAAEGAGVGWMDCRYIQIVEG